MVKNKLKRGLRDTISLLNYLWKHVAYGIKPAGSSCPQVSPAVTLPAFRRLAFWTPWDCSPLRRSLCVIWPRQCSCLASRRWRGTRWGSRWARLRARAVDW
jgi:hypothetical protein